MSDLELELKELLLRKKFHVKEIQNLDTRIIELQILLLKQKEIAQVELENQRFLDHYNKIL